MIKKLYIILALVGGFFISSCDNYLDIKPVGVVIPQTLTEYRALFTTAYEFSTSDRSLCDMRTGYAIIRDNDYDKNSYGDIEKWVDVNSNTATAEFGWSNYYSAIYYSNAIIDKKDEIKNGTQSEINQLVGEAYLMRANQHFNLANLYGQPYTKEGATSSKAIPLKLNLDLEEVTSRNTLKDVFASILSDIQSARELINVTKWEEELSYRFSTLSVDALEARVRLYMGDWEKAYELSEKVLEVKSSLEDFNLDSSLLPNHYQSVEMITAYEKYYTSSTSSAIRTTESLINLYGPNDLRLEKYYVYDTTPNRKIAKNDGSSKYRCSFRTGEYYLNSAESAARLGNLEQAKTRLFKLMSKRYNSEGYNEKVIALNKMNQDELITEILNERARELAFEGHTWFDLRRTTRPQIIKTIDNKNYTLSEDDERYTLPIPKSAINANPGLAN